MFVKHENMSRGIKKNRKVRNKSKRKIIALEDFFFLSYMTIVFFFRSVPLGWFFP
jgi:hypothetical protein